MKSVLVFRGLLIAATFVLTGSLIPGVGSVPAYAQGITTGSLDGTIVDQTGAVLAGATVAAAKADTNTRYTAKTSANGTFSVKDMQVGTYVVTVSANGFSTLTLNAVIIDSNRDNPLGKQTLKAGGSAETVEVSATSNLLETTQAQVTTSFDTEALTNLPVAGGFDELALLIPGVVSTHANNFSNTNGVGFSVNGERGRSNNFELDGQSNNDNSVAGPQFFFSNDEALAQVQIITNDFSAQYGRNAGSVVNYITKSGTNQIHGSAIYRYSGDFTSSLATGVSKGPQFGFCAKGENPSDGCTVPVVPRYVNNIYGGTLGAPIIKDKLFAFGSTYWYKLYEFGALTSSAGNALFPTTSGLQQLAAAFPNSPNAIAILKQLSPYSVTSGNPRQTSGVTTKTITNGTVSAPIDFAQFGRQIPSSSLDQEHLGRLDYQATDKDRFFVRYAYQLNPTSPYSPVAAGGYANVTGTTHSIGSDWSHIFSSRVVSTLRYSFQQSKLAFDGGGFPNCTITSYLTCPSSISIGSGYSSLGLASGFPQGRIVKVGQIQSNTTLTLGKHSFTFGGEFDYQNSPNVFLPNQNGSFSYGSFSNFLNGIGTLNLTNGNPTVPFKENDVAVYFQDDWKVSSTLTFNLGMRWEFFQQAINLLHNQTVAQQTGPNPFWNTALPLSKTTFPQIPQSYRNFEPRFGFAYNPDFARKLVVRGGYAINVDPGFYNINLNSATSAPVVNAGTITCDGVTISCLPTGGATFATVTAQYLKYIPTGGDPGARNQTFVSANFRQPITQTYTLATQYQIQNAAVIEIRYTGNHTSGNFQTLDGNPYLLPVATDFPNVVAPSSLCTAANSTLSGGSDIGRLHCGSSNVRLRANTSFANYNSLQANLTTRAYHGVTGTMAYTHSRTIDNSSEIFSTLGGGNTSAFAENPLDPNFQERAVSGLDFPNTASAGLTYQFPKYSSSHEFFGKLINGWTASTIWLYNSGQPYSDFDFYAAQSGAANYGDQASYLPYSNYKEEAAYNGGYSFSRPILSNKNAPATAVGIYTTTAASPTTPVLLDYGTGNPTTTNSVHWIENNRWACRIAGTPFCGSGRNLERGNTYNNVDLTVFKNTKITEHINFRLEADAFNVLNRSYYGTPDNYIGDTGSSFNTFLYNGAGGSNIGTGTGVRNMQFGAKILF